MRCLLATLFAAQAASSLILAQTVLVEGLAEPLPDPSGWRACWEGVLKKNASKAAESALADALLQHLNGYGIVLVAVEAEQTAAGFHLQVTEGVITQASVSGGTSGQRAVVGAAWERLVSKPRVRLHEIQDLLASLHRNPHLAVLPKFQPVSDSVADAEALVDLSGSARPYGVSAGWGNDGVEPLASQRLWLEFEESDFGGVPHYLSLRSQVGEDPSQQRAWRGLLRGFFPWGHEVSLQGLWSQGRLPEADQEVEADTWQLGARYVVPLHFSEHWKLDLALGGDFRRTNNTFAAGGEKVGLDADSVHLVGELTLLRETVSGQTGLSLVAGLSPGDVTDGNSALAYASLRPEAVPEYSWVRLAAWRRWSLASGGSFSLRGFAQYASEPLLPYDQLPVGGSQAVRGFGEASGLADTGGWLSAEVALPPLRFGEGAWRSAVQPVLFCDAGVAQVSQAAEGALAAVAAADAVAGPAAAEMAPPVIPTRSVRETLLSAGLGLRVQISEHWSLAIDHAWRISGPDAAEAHGGWASGRFHLSASCKF